MNNKTRESQIKELGEAAANLANEYRYRLNRKGYHWSESVFSAVADTLKLDIDKTLVRMATGFHGGGGAHREPMPDKPMEGVGASFRPDIKMTPTGHLCGALAAGIIIIGYVFGRRSPDDDITCPSELASELHRRFEEEMGTKMCDMLRPFQMKITSDPDKKDDKGHCGNTYAAGARLAVEVILSAKDVCPLCPELEIPS